MIIYVKGFPIPKMSDAITIWPFIFCRRYMHIFYWINNRYINVETYLKMLLKHERVHWWDQLKTLLVGFYLSYGIMYLANRIRGMNHYQAYRAIWWEIRARRIAGI